MSEHNRRSVSTCCISFHCYLWRGTRIIRISHSAVAARRIRAVLSHA